jgi:branched-chain amino acid transport system substrate-binding protein
MSNKYSNATNWWGACLSIGVIFGASIVAWPQAAMAQIKIGVVASATGPTSVVGISQENTAALLPRTMGDVPVEYIVLDDGSDSTQTVQDFKRLISQDHVDAIIGPSGSPNAVSVIQFAAEAHTPMLAPVGTAAVVLPMDDVKKWVFKTTQNDGLIAAALVQHMHATGIKTVGVIASNDPFGQGWVKTFAALTTQAGIQTLDTEYFQRTDTSVTAQSLKLLAANPDAILVAAAGGPTVLPETTLVDQGYRGKIYQTHGAATPEFLRLGGRQVEGTILAASLMLVMNEVSDSVPSKKVAADYIAAYKKLYGVPPATFGANVYDAGLLLAAAVPSALKAGQPGTVAFRTALRDALEQTKEVVGPQGVYNMSPADHSGFDERGRVLITVKDGAWHLLP